MKVIIPSAKLIPPELQNIGKIPAIIYPINQGISFDFFKLRYDLMVSEIDVICYEKAEKVQETLSNYNLSTKIKLIVLDKLEDLGYSIYHGLTNEDRDVIIHFADTIMMDSLSFDMAEFFCAAEEHVSDIWTFYDIEDGRLTYINDKTQPSVEFSEESKIKPFFVGIFKISNGAYFKECLEIVRKMPSQGMDSFYAALKLYSETHKFQPIYVKDWFDIGHAQKYFETRMQVESRTFNHIEIDQDRGILKKTSNDVEKFIGEIKWYLKLPVDIEYIRPRIFDYSINYNQPYINMEYYSYRTLHELFLYGDLSGEQWKQIFKKIKFVLEDLSRYTLKVKNLNDELCAMYLSKTLNRMDKMRTLSSFKSLFNQPFNINGRVYQPLNQVIHTLENIIPELLYDVDSFSIIHGDLCFPNIMVDNNLKFIKLIDPRGKFGKYDIYGDSRYEIAKLLHSIEGKYDFIIKNLFNLEIYEDNNFHFKVLESSRAFDLQKIFIEVFEDRIKDNLKAITLIESLLFLSMIPMHNENLNHQYAMLCVGMGLLDKVANITYPPPR